MASDRRTKGPVSFSLVRRLKFSASEVFSAWTDPATVALWLAPGSAQVTSVTSDLRFGGSYRIEGRDNEGAPYAISGDYRQIEPDKRISMSWSYDGAATALKGRPSLVTANLRPLGEDLTELTIVHEELSTRHAADLNRQNWMSCIDNLEAALQPHVELRGPAKLAAINNFYRDSHREMQDQFGTRQLADRLRDVTVRPALMASDAAFIAHQNMFFLATADLDGKPNCSYKGGKRGFVSVIDERTIAFPSYDGNGMFMSAGNLRENPHVGLLFLDFERQARLRVSGTAEIDTTARLLKRYPGADLIVRVHVRSVFGNCPRYVHKMELVEESSFVPTAGHPPPPAAEWKQLAEFSDVLPDRDAEVAGNETDERKAMNRD
jgi:uncharacterized protein YndB with AHSA1/START domain/predicted pyridoxine 5'-phosphate oxidase superfamily flavin-nucleotide-binding protein